MAIQNHLDRWLVRRRRRRFLPHGLGGAGDLSGGAPARSGGAGDYFVEVTKMIADRFVGPNKTIRRLISIDHQTKSMRPCTTSSRTTYAGC